jgi:hypothetical protein
MIGSKRGLLDFIYKYESGGNYNRWNTQTVNAPKIPITEMLVGDIIKFQAAEEGHGGAAGAGQIKVAKMRELVEAGVLRLDEKFSDKAQDRANSALLDGRGFNEWVSGALSQADYGNNLAMEYASVPLLSDFQHEERGLLQGGFSFYGNDAAGNSAGAHPKDFSDVLTDTYTLAQTAAQTDSLEKQNNDGIFAMVDGAKTGLPAGGLASFLNTLGDSSLSDEEELAFIVGRLEADGVANPEGLASILFKAKKESENSAASSALTERQGLFQGLYDSGEAPRIDLIGDPAEVTQAPARRGGAPSGASALGRFGIESLVPSGG